MLEQFMELDTSTKLYLLVMVITTALTIIHLVRYYQNKVLKSLSYAGEACMATLYLLALMLWDPNTVPGIASFFLAISGIIIVSSFYFIECHKLQRQDRLKELNSVVLREDPLPAKALKSSIIAWVALSSIMTLVYVLVTYIRENMTIAGALFSGFLMACMFLLIYDRLLLMIAAYFWQQRALKKQSATVPTEQS